ncbi:SRPBCC domain-containing protein [Saccharomonospora xinjiangensis]|uniref:SRPBCC family protein n=1 Tax=Saccharomonospora xinjiangensis TaxID=75294 RepID=UPI00350FA416
MPIISVHKDPDTLTLTFVAEFPAAVERIWRVWEDPRQLERWWGPPTWPATFEQHDFTVGGRSRYHMTGPDGGRSNAWWRITAIDAPHRLEFDDGFADDNGEPAPGMPSVHCVVTLEPTRSGTRMTTVSHFADTEQMEQLLSMGMEEGMREAMSQIDRLLIPTAG